MLLDKERDNLTNLIKQQLSQMIKSSQSQGKSSNKLNSIRGILHDIKVLHEDCQKDLEEQEALIVLLKQLQGNTSGISGRRRPTPPRFTSGASGRRRPTSPRDTSGASSRHHTPPPRDTSGPSGRPTTDRSNRPSHQGARQGGRHHHPYQRPSGTSPRGPRTPLSGANAVPVSRSEGVVASHPTIQQPLPQPPPLLPTSLWERRSLRQAHTPIAVSAGSQLTQPSRTLEPIPSLSVPKPSEELPTAAGVSGVAAKNFLLRRRRRTKPPSRTNQTLGVENLGRETVDERLARKGIFIEAGELSSEAEENLLQTPDNVKATDKVAELSKNLQDQSLKESYPVNVKMVEPSSQ